ncbi:MAG: hypothetical protein U0168_27770 [Nannocystaceae bacterium]
MRTERIPTAEWFLAAVLTGCGTSNGSGLATTGTSSADASSGAGDSDSTSAEPVTCGAPGDEAATDQAIAALAGCEVYRGDLTLLADVSSLEPLTSLRVIEGQVFLGGTNSPLAGLAGLEELESVGKLSMNSHNLSSLEPLQSLQTVRGDFVFLSMFNLSDFRGLESLREIEGNFELTANPSLSSLDGLDGLQRVAGNFEATSYMTPLPRAAVQELVDRIEIGGDVNID